MYLKRIIGDFHREKSEPTQNVSHLFYWFARVHGFEGI